MCDSQPSGLWSRETARLLMEKALAADGAERVRGIIAAHDDMAVGIAEVVIARGLAGQIALVGSEGDQEGLELIRSGVMTGRPCRMTTAQTA